MHELTDSAQWGRSVVTPAAGMRMSKKQIDELRNDLEKDYLGTLKELVNIGVTACDSDVK